MKKAKDYGGSMREKTCNDSMAEKIFYEKGGWDKARED